MEQVTIASCTSIHGPPAILSTRRVQQMKSRICEMRHQIRVTGRKTRTRSSSGLRASVSVLESGTRERAVDQKVRTHGVTRARVKADFGTILMPDSGFEAGISLKSLHKRLLHGENKSSHMRRETDCSPHDLRLRDSRPAPDLTFTPPNEFTADSMIDGSDVSHNHPKRLTVLRTWTREQDLVTRTHRQRVPSRDALIASSDCHSKHT